MKSYHILLIKKRSTVCEGVCIITTILVQFQTRLSKPLLSLPNQISGTKCVYAQHTIVAVLIIIIIINLCIITIQVVCPLPMYDVWFKSFYEQKTMHSTAHHHRNNNDNNKQLKPVKQIDETYFVKRNQAKKNWLTRTSVSLSWWHYHQNGLIYLVTYTSYEAALSKSFEKRRVRLSRNIL